MAIQIVHRTRLQPPGEGVWSAGTRRSALMSRGLGSKRFKCPANIERHRAHNDDTRADSLPLGPCPWNGTNQFVNGSCNGRCL